MSDTLEVQLSKEARFVNYIIERSAQNKGVAANLRRANNPNTEYQSWEYLAPFVDLEKPWQREPYALIAADIAKTKAAANGSLTFGQAIAGCYPDGYNDDQAKAKLRRVLTCASTDEACRILRPLLSLIASRIAQPLNYAQLLEDLVKFQWHAEQIKARWAQQFYKKGSSEVEPLGEGQ